MSFLLHQPGSDLASRDVGGGGINGFLPLLPRDVLLASMLSRDRRTTATRLLIVATSSTCSLMIQCPN
jgi:hypothetical protein